MPHQSDLRLTRQIGAGGMDLEVIEFTLDEAPSETCRTERNLTSTRPSVDFDTLFSVKGVKGGTVRHLPERRSSMRADGCHLVRHGGWFWMNGA